MSEDEAKAAANEQFWNQVGKDFVAGAISGAVFGGVANTVNSVQYHKMGKTINQDNTMRDTILKQQSRCRRILLQSRLRIQ